MAETIIHTIEPVYDAQSRILILGSIPSPKSREYGFFYGHPQNRFWKVLSAVLDVPLPISNMDKKQMLLTHKIALWDVLHACTIDGAEDASIKSPVPNDLSCIFDTADIHTVYTTGTKAYALYKKHIQPQTGICAVALPSTSPANCAWSLDALIGAYAAIAVAVKPQADSHKTILQHLEDET